MRSYTHISQCRIQAKINHKDKSKSPHVHKGKNPLRRDSNYKHAHIKQCHKTNHIGHKSAERSQNNYIG
jgi:hypothetical protein